jgi:N-acetylmuramoyl-L-alanine amidase
MIYFCIMKWSYLLIASFFLGGSFVPAPAKEKITVVIDPGHGGSDPGHLSSDKNHKPEKELNLIIAKKFGTYLQKYLNNVTVIYTRSDDSFPTLDDRVNVANSMGVDYFVSIHCNANERKTVHGTESHIHSMQSKSSVNLAKEFEKEFSTRAGRKSRGVKDSDDRAHSLQVLKYTRMTSVLVECGFLTNEKEAVYLNTDYGQDILASAIFRGFRSHITHEHPGIKFVKPVSSASTFSSSSTTTTAKPTTNSTGKYHIQIMSSKEAIDTQSPEFKKLGLGVTRTKLNTSSTFKYRYTIGPYSNSESAGNDLEKVKKNGFKDAYIINLSE